MVVIDGIGGIKRGRFRGEVHRYHVGVVSHQAMAVLRRGERTGMMSSKQLTGEFKGEVEAIGRVRHKNLVRLLGYCVEGAYRMLVYKYVDSGNREQWLHGDVGDVSRLTWRIRTSENHSEV
ncbi:hypothetical protein M8C21_027091 [Ambrosia artemisiifolia]|uniref:non-specific serine/threonine protein kinase n=1 Tax=Ambrosia artemisiifolia TaxID=4212 RepID=A0AAD5D636_AMBAR|nr:hypothetical protein M8C21_027091 [Ambrosia artemisiifolia]